MDEPTLLAEQFEEHRPHLRSVAYRMLGSLSESDDAVQEAWLRLSRTDQRVENLGGWLTTVVGRVCLDMLRARRARQEDYVGSWLPEPIVSIDEQSDPEQEALIADSVGLALLVVLETLTPPERLAFVLHDMFGFPFEEIAPIVGRSPEATRQLASRARRRVQGANPARRRRPVGPAGRRRRVPRGFARRRLRRAPRGPRPRRRLPRRHRPGPTRCPADDERGARSRQAGALTRLAPCAARAAGARQRRCGSRRRTPRAAVRRRRIHRVRRPDHRDRPHHRPCEAAPLRLQQ